MTDLVLTEDRGAARHVILNRPEKRNAFNRDLVLAVGDALRAAADDPDVHCVVLRGEGPMFSSGMDLGALADLAESPETLPVPPRLPGGVEPPEEMTKPTICRSTAPASAVRSSWRWRATCA